MRKLAAFLLAVTYMVVPFAFGTAALASALPASGHVLQIADGKNAICQGAGGSLSTNEPKVSARKCDAGIGDLLPASISGITKALLVVAGAIAVIVIIVGGLRYILSQGNSQSVTAAKDTILYAVVGLVIVLLSYAVVSYVSSNVK